MRYWKRIVESPTNKKLRRARHEAAGAPGSSQGPTVPQPGTRSSSGPRLSSVGGNPFASSENAAGEAQDSGTAATPRMGAAAGAKGGADGSHVAMQMSANVAPPRNTRGSIRGLGAGGGRTRSQ